VHPSPSSLPPVHTFPLPSLIETQLMMQEWMTVIDAAIQGVPEQAQRRRQTVNHKYSLRAQVRDTWSQFVILITLVVSFFNCGE